MRRRLIRMNRKSREYRKAKKVRRKNFDKRPAIRLRICTSAH
jgi:hypothetical protein